MTPSRSNPRNITYPKQEKRSEWSEYASYPNIVKRWKELDDKSKRAERIVRYWQIAAAIGWTVVLVFILIILAQ